jgi:hypothetical protein
LNAAAEFVCLAEQAGVVRMCSKLGEHGPHLFGELKLFVVFRPVEHDPS